MLSASLVVAAAATLSATHGCSSQPGKSGASGGPPAFSGVASGAAGGGLSASGGATNTATPVTGSGGSAAGSATSSGEGNVGVGSLDNGKATPAPVPAETTRLPGLASGVKRAKAAA